VPTYATPEEAVRAFLDLVAYDRRQRLLRQVPTEQAALEACGGRHRGARRPGPCSARR
jgi:acyl-CoA synthetase (NDP forming)